MRRCEVRDLGRMEYGAALEIQKGLADRRKKGEIADHLLFVEHPHVITMGRNGDRKNLLAGEEVLRRAGIAYFPIDRGGDITYHGPGQVVGYPVIDLKEWKRDVVAYVRGIEQVIIESLAEFGIDAGRDPGHTGVWVDGRKIAALGVHISRWVTTHGFALNHTTDLSYFQYIVPCGLTLPVTSMENEGAAPERTRVIESLAKHFARHFDFELVEERETV